MNTYQAIGRLTQDPEKRFTPNGTSTATIRLAISRRKRNGQDQPPVYVDVVSFGAQADAVAEHLSKGRRVAITGRLEYREWKDKDNNPRSKHEIVADSVEFMDPPRANGSGAEQSFEPDEEPF